jgi:hypothetical protein
VNLLFSINKLAISWFKVSNIKSSPHANQLLVLALQSLNRSSCFNLRLQLPARLHHADSMIQFHLLIKAGKQSEYNLFHAHAL